MTYRVNNDLCKFSQEDIVYFKQGSYIFMRMYLFL